MTPAALRRACLGREGTTEKFPFGPQTSVFKVAGKMFALSALRARPLKVSLKCEPELAEALRDSYAEIQPGYHLNKRHWNTVELDGTVDGVDLRQMIEHSYELVVSSLPQAEQPGLRGSRHTQRGGDAAP